MVISRIVKEILILKEIYYFGHRDCLYICIFIVLIIYFFLILCCVCCIIILLTAMKTKFSFT